MPTFDHKRCPINTMVRIVSAPMVIGATVYYRGYHQNTHGVIRLFYSETPEAQILRSTKRDGLTHV